jgi:hypothetical protein
VEPRGEFAQAELVDPGSSQFDRKRNPVEAPADFRDDRCIGVAQLEFVERGGGLLDEKLDGGESKRLQKRSPDLH